MSAATTSPEIIAAWNDYLQATRSQWPLERYLEIEPWAWQKLQTLLTAQAARRRYARRRNT